MQNRDMENVLLLTRVNKHNALLAQGVHCLKIKDRESGTIEMLKEKVRKKPGVVASSIIGSWGNIYVFGRLFKSRL